MPLFGLADCNNFFCSCERVFRPDLRERPVVVLSNNDGCIVARSNESKRLGLKMGEPYFKVRTLLEREGVAVFSSNYTLYGDMSARVMSLLSRFTPELQRYSIDEAFLDLEGIFAPSELGEYGAQIVRSVTQGTGIPISLGIAPTKTLAKMASRFAKQHAGYHGVCLIDTPEKRKRAAALFPIADVWGIGRRSAERLNQMGVHTAVDFIALGEARIRREFSVTGVRTRNELLGESCISIDELPHKQSICTSRSFPDAGLHALAPLEQAIGAFADSCARKLVEQHTVCEALTVFAQTSRFRTDVPQHYLSCDVHFPVATASVREILPAALSALRTHWGGERYGYKKAGVIVWNISPANAVQGNLFDQRNRPSEAALSHTLHNLALRFGHGAVRPAVLSENKNERLRRDFLSPRYTTSLDDLIQLRTD